MFTIIHIILLGGQHNYEETTWYLEPAHAMILHAFHKLLLLLLLNLDNQLKI